MDWDGLGGRFGYTLGVIWLDWRDLGFDFLFSFCCQILVVITLNSMCLCFDFHGFWYVVDSPYQVSRR
jgi:hypothetical protein